MARTVVIGDNSHRLRDFLSGDSSGPSTPGGPGGHGPPNDLGLKGKELNIWALDHIFWEKKWLSLLRGGWSHGSHPSFFITKEVEVGWPSPDSTEFYQWNIVDFIRIVSEIWSGPVFEKIQNLFQLQNFSAKLKVIIEGAAKIHSSCGSWICNLLVLHLFSRIFFL